MRFRIASILFAFGLLLSCSTSSNMNKQLRLKPGTWRATLQLTEKEELPFNFEVDSAGHISIINAEERIMVTDIVYDDSGNVNISFPVFSTFVRAKLDADTLRGEWVNPEKKDYKLPFFAQYGRKERFAAAEAAPAFDANGKWEVTFSPGTEGAYKAIGIFEQKGHRITGTFLTETGDYRYLEGQVEDGHISLSCFDAAHAFLFRAKGNGDKIEGGTFWSGNHWSEPWIALKNEKFRLADPDTLTYLQAGYERLNFRLPNENGDSIGLSDAAFKNKVLIVQIMGSWCPNCMDESVFLVEMYKKYHSQGLEIIAIDYEIRNDSAVFKKNVARMRKDLGISYPIVFGGPSKKIDAAKTLPMLNHILSYPTTIFIGKAGKIEKIQTGFSGPGTGKNYVDYKVKTTRLIENLLSQ